MFAFEMEACGTVCPYVCATHGEFRRQSYFLEKGARLGGVIESLRRSKMKSGGEVCSWMIGLYALLEVLYLGLTCRTLDNFLV